jgi:hypothetical protein
MVWITEIDRDRLSARDHLIAAQVGLEVQLVDDPLVLQDLRDEPQVGVAHRVDRADELALDEPAHHRHRAAHRVDVGVELAEGVVGHPSAPYRGRLQPKRPVM